MIGKGAFAALLGMTLLASCGEGKKPGAPEGNAPGVATGAVAAPQDGEATITAPAEAVAGAEIEVAWTGPGNPLDYIDIVTRGATETREEISYTYLRNTENGRVVVRAPTTAGEYDVRYVLELGSERQVKSRSPLTVSLASAAVTAPERAGGGEVLSVAWTGPAGRGDYIDIVPAGSTAVSGELVYAYTSEGSPAKLTAPGASGAYDVRYVLEGPGGRKVIATSPLNVTTPSATLSAPASIAGGAVVRVTWDGPKRAGDYVDLVPKGYAETSGELDYFYVDRPGASELTAPMSAGEFELRYVMEAPGGRIVLARQPVTVR